jgi:hypothetical protein
VLVIRPLCTAADLCIPHDNAHAEIAFSLADLKTPGNELNSSLAFSMTTVIQIAAIGERRGDMSSVAFHFDFRSACAYLAMKQPDDLDPKSVHVADLVIDAVIDVPWTRNAFSQAEDGSACNRLQLLKKCIPRPIKTAQPGHFSLKSDRSRKPGRTDVPHHRC